MPSWSRLRNSWPPPVARFVLAPVLARFLKRYPEIVLETTVESGLTDIVAAAAGDPTLPARTWVLVTESPEGGWGIDGYANTGDDIVTAARAEIGAIAAARIITE